MRIRSRYLVVCWLLAMGVACNSSSDTAPMGTQSSASKTSGTVQTKTTPPGTTSGVLISPGDLSKADWAALYASIEDARRSDPRSFKMLAEYRGMVAPLDAAKRGRYAPYSVTLKGWGQRALMPMLNELAVDAPPRGQLNDTAWLAWRVGLLEAVGTLRDPRSAPVVTAVLDSQVSEYLVIRAAAQALGKLGTDDAAETLIGLSLQAGVKRLGVLAGMGHCRRLDVAERLARALASTSDPDEAKVIARSLGDLGSAWAWKTPAGSASGKPRETRSTAAAALVAAFVALPFGDVQKVVTLAILVVDDPTTPELIAEARKRAAPQHRAALDRLRARFDKSPLR